jgi:hypothetical protein
MYKTTYYKHSLSFILLTLRYDFALEFVIVLLQALGNFNSLMSTDGRKFMKDEGGRESS